MTNERRSTGPRAILKAKKCREVAATIAIAQQEQVREKQNDSPYDPNQTTTAQDSQVLAKQRLVRPSVLNVSSEEELKKLSTGNGGQEHAVTYWSHELQNSRSSKPHFAVTPLQGPSPFAKCTRFSNDIEDSRLQHNETE